ncbi:hypothetical protein BNJ_00376 [Kaumoebavirus]|nr:hypothetical protein BNJ_00376 [Kaumoebavirus]ARA72196.1 hypothetical protein BNJ_00376 [Kaumoebavirus]
METVNDFLILIFLYSTFFKFSDREKRNFEFVLAKVAYRPPRN